MENPHRTMPKIPNPECRLAGESGLFGIWSLGFGIWDFLVRREIAASGEDFRAFEVGTRHADLDLPPRAVLLGVAGGIRQAVLRANLRDDPVVRRLDVLHRRREKRLSARGFRNLRQV